MLGRAAAAVLGAHAIGLSRAETEAVRDRLRAMLEVDGDPPAAPFEQLAILRVARTHKSRHASILLPLQATLDALSAYRSQAKADPDPHRRQPKRSLRLVPGPPAWR